MASDRMMQAIGRMERALSQLERFAQQPAAAAPPDGSRRQEVVAALRQLDSLISDLKGKPHG